MIHFSRTIRFISLRYFEAFLPVNSLNSLLKLEKLLNPHSKQMSEILLVLSDNNFVAHFLGIVCIH
tara:strand:+ start:1530 stop:1727 length:198 start_codon:yes stop_codon:yes gene_type:complete